MRKFTVPFSTADMGSTFALQSSVLANTGPIVAIAINPQSDVDACLVYLGADTSSGIVVTADAPVHGFWETPNTAFRMSPSPVRVPQGTLYCSPYLQYSRYRGAGFTSNLWGPDTILKGAFTVLDFYCLDDGEIFQVAPPIPARRGVGAVNGLITIALGAGTYDFRIPAFGRRQASFHCVSETVGGTFQWQIIGENGIIDGGGNCTTTDVELLAPAAMLSGEDQNFEWSGCPFDSFVVNLIPAGGGTLAYFKVNLYDLT